MRGGRLREVVAKGGSTVLVSIAMHRGKTFIPPLPYFLNMYMSPLQHARAACYGISSLFIRTACKDG